MTTEDVQNLKNRAIAQIINSENEKELEETRISLLGAKGEITTAVKSLGQLPAEERKTVGRAINETLQIIRTEITNKKLSFQEKKEDVSWFDPTPPGIKPLVGKLHPTTLVINEMVEIFKHLGFSVYEGPEIETDEYNFERLNLPKDHPGRSLQDALYLKEPEIVLRSQTSSVEARALATLEPPYRIIVPGKCYRFENVNATNNAMFYQFQGFALQKGLSMADLKGTLFSFIYSFFGKDRKVRFRCKYYPEVEPGGGVDLDCQFCHQKGCSVCKGRGWIEMLGCGMIHPQMIKVAGRNPNEISGFAFGMGLDRIVMDYFGIPDIRSLYNGDIAYSL